MRSEQGTRSEVTVHVENIGGIDETSINVSPGVTILEGENATNRTSLLQALAAACGSDLATLKGDADQGHVDLSLGEATYSRRVSRRNGTVQSSGDSYLDDSTLADLFAFLLESNEARQAVAQGTGLRELIMRPVDTEAIQDEIDQLIEERQSVDKKLEKIESLKGDLPELEAERTRLQKEIESKQKELAEKERELEDIDGDPKDTRKTKAELEGRLDNLRSKRSDLDNTRYDIETEQERLEALIKERNELQSEQDDLPEPLASKVSELEHEIDRLRTKKQTSQSEINELQSVIGFNEGMLEDADEELFDALQENGVENPTDQLVEHGAVSCWTCGSEVDRDQIKQTIETLRDLNTSKYNEVTELEDRIAELKEELQSIEQKQRERERVEHRLDKLETDIKDQTETISQLKDRREQLREEIADLEAAVEELENDTYSDIIKVNKEANHLEYELGRLESELERVECEISEFEDQINQQSGLEAKREDLQTEIVDRRTKIDRIERTSIEEFNEHMETVLELLNYDNLDRIWIERTEEEVREGRRKVSKSTFDLHVIRSTTSGTTYEDTIDHLSESEREVTGLIFVLAGYLAHQVYEKVPFMLLDSLEAIDSTRIATLVDYLSEYSRYLVVALLPEDAAALDESHERVTSI